MTIFVKCIQIAAEHLVADVLAARTYPSRRIVDRDDGLHIVGRRGIEEFIPRFEHKDASDPARSSSIR